MWVIDGRGAGLSRVVGVAYVSWVYRPPQTGFGEQELSLFESGLLFN